MSLSRPNWLSYLVIGVAALVVSYVFSGCRIGNHVSTAPNNDPLSGYYNTQPQTLTFCVGLPNSPCAAVSASQVPSLVSSVMTNPVGLIVKDYTQGTAYLVPANNDQVDLPIGVDSSNNLSFTGFGQAAVLWNDPACTAQLSIDEKGALTQSAANTDANGFTILGKIQLDISVITTFSGPCAATLTQMQACYQDATQCGGTDTTTNQQLQASIQGMFNPYINAGVMTAADMPNVTALAYEIKYQ